jgi:adenylate kinase
MSKRYFINNVDKLIGDALLRELTKGEDEIERLHMATYFDQQRIDKGRGVKKILKRWKPKLSRKKMLEEIDVYVYDLHSSDARDVEYGASIFENATLEE